jgi:hypothetical protein
VAGTAANEAASVPRRLNRKARMIYDSTADPITEPTVGEAGNVDFAPAPLPEQPQQQPVFGGRSVLVCDQESVVAVMHCLDAETITDEGFQQCYPPEAGALAGLNGPHMSVPRGYVVDAGGWIVASIRGHVEGVSLAEVLLGRTRGLDVQAAATVAKDTLTALGALHRSGIAHRRISADQVIVRTEGSCVLIDAGLAPREGSHGPDGDLAADLIAVAELFAVCLEGRRAAIQPGAQRGRSAAHQAGDMAEYLFTLLTTPTLAHIPVGERAVGVLTVLDSVMVEHFGLGWEEYGREELAARVDAVRRAYFRTTTTASEAVEANAGAGHGLRRGRHANANANKGARHTQKPQQRAVRYGGPLFAFTVAFTLVLIVASHATTSTTEAKAGSTPVAVRPGTVASGASSASNPRPRTPAAPAVDAAQSSSGSHSQLTTAFGIRTVHWNSTDTGQSHRSSGSGDRSR